MAKTFPYTGWDTTNLVNNCRKYLAKSIRKISDRITKPIRDSISTLNAQSQQEDRVKKDLDMAKLAVLVEVLFNIAEHNKHENCPENMAIGNRLLEIAVPNGQSGQRIIRFVERMAKGNADWDQFSYTLQMALNIFTKRSACFKEVKQDLLETFECEDINEWSTKYNKFKTLVENLESRASVGTSVDVKIQNSGAILNKDRIGLKGDAERNQRVGWSVSGKLPDYNQIQSNIHYALHGNKVKIMEVSKVNDEQIVPIESRVVRVLLSIGNHQSVTKAIAFVKKLPELKCEELISTGAPFHHFCDLMKICGVDQELDHIVKELFEHFLLEWNTEPLISESRALKVFKQ